MSVPRASRSLPAALVALGAFAAWAGRPPEVLEQEQREEALALDYLVRKTDSLSAQLVDRRTHLRKRLRALYKLSQGGYLRLLLGADSPTSLFERRNISDRILHRDITELEAVREELAELRGLRERLREAEGRAAALLTEAREAQRAGATVEKVRFRKPVPGAVVRPFGHYKEQGLELSRDGLELGAHPGEPVLAPAGGAVRGVVDLPGIGESVIVEYTPGDGGEPEEGARRSESWTVVVGGLRNVRVRLGAHVRPGNVLGEAAGTSVVLQLGQGRTWVDPALFLGGVAP